MLEPIILIASNSLLNQILPTKIFENIDAVLERPFNRIDLINAIRIARGEKKVCFKNKDMIWYPDPNALVEIKNKRILIVEDLEINQKLISEILKNWGLDSKNANNGMEAVAMTQAEQFDLVLMDIQMPIMDGYSATRKIRENSAYANIPIIAMTAHAMTDDRDRVLAEGLNDFVSKPIKIDRFFYVLHGWLTNQTNQRIVPTRALNQDNIPITKSFEKEIDLSIGLENTMGNRALYSDLLVQFNDRIEKELPELISIISKQQTGKPIEIIHNIKGLSGNLGIYGLYSIAQEFHDALITDEPNNYMPKFIEFLRVSKKVKNIIPDFIQTHLIN